MKPNVVRANAHSCKEIFEANLKNKGIETTDFQLELLRRFYEILILTNQRINLVSRSKEQNTSILDQILDSLLAQGLVKVIAPQIVLDLGSGGGFPGIPLAILNPNIQFHLLEASHKRVSHLKKATGLLSLQNTQVIHDRVENMPGTLLMRKYDLVIARSVVDLPTLVEWCRPLLDYKGILVTYAGNQEAWCLERLLRAWPEPLKPLLVRSIDLGIRPEKTHRFLVMGNFG